MNRIAQFACAALAGTMLLSTPAFAASEVVGKWDLVAQTQMGEMKSTMTVAPAGEGYSIDIAEAPMAPPSGGGDAPAMGPMESTISDVKVAGSDFSFKRHLKTDQFDIDLAYSGSVAGDTLTATAGSDFGDTAITGKRIK